MRRSVWGLLVFMMLAMVSPAMAGTGGGEDSSSGVQDIDVALRTAVRWILAIKGYKVIQSERTADLNSFYIDQRAANSNSLASIIDGLTKRKWKLTRKQDAKGQIIEAVKDDKKLRIFMAKAGKEPRLTVEIRKTK